MTVGIEIYHPDGSLQFSSLDYLARISGAAQTFAANGNVTYTGPDPHRLWAAFIGRVTGAPNISIGGSVIYWSYDFSYYGGPSDGWIIYGVR